MLIKTLAKILNTAENLSKTHIVKGHIMFKEITPHILNEWMNESDVILIDVREPSEFDHERIKNALHIPLSLVTFDQLQLSNKKRIVFQCRSGKRSQLACQRIVDDISEDMELYSLEGGILAWREAGFPVLTGPIKPTEQTSSMCLSSLKCPLSFRSCLHRLCFVAGLSIFITMLLSATASPNFVWGFVLVAIGLIVAAFKSK
ncbi:MAG: rhodanese-like domain-containing protein [Pseudomonadota bacterium]